MNPYVILQKYYSSNEEAYDILVNHSESVANKALSIAHNHPELKIDTEFVFQAAMLHDIGIHLTNAPSIACYGSASVIPATGSSNKISFGQIGRAHV